MGKETRGSVRDRALGSVGLFLIVLIGLASGWGRTGRVVIWLVAAIGWLVDRVSFEHSVCPDTDNHGGVMVER